ncbi:hypothetical protein RRG08_057458 [Elysia crispata]|uniref:G-protein coupled receptors family 1 profile domain-containing protein n=1 Tax=Elysia crispata TaxID=231223 RepID=A0AAE0Z413_9GAST|nr:hypothetical protein RRG08_057458 [Elysia crispata]
MKVCTRLQERAGSGIPKCFMTASSEMIADGWNCSEQFADTIQKDLCRKSPQPPDENNRARNTNVMARPQSRFGQKPVGSILTKRGVTNLERSSCTMELSTPSPSGPHVFLSPGVFVSRLFNNNLTFILNLIQTSVPKNTSVTLSPGQNGNFDYPCPPLSEEKLRLIEALEEATKIQVDTIFSIALIFGLPGSVLALVIVSSMAASPTTLYMSSLAMSDLATLFLASLTSYKVTNGGSLTLFDKNSIYVCRIFQAFSHWNLALICVERFVSVRYPFQKSRLYTRRAMFLSVGAAFIVSSVPFPLFPP